MDTHLQDHIAIQQAISSYSLDCSTGAWDRVLALYLPHASWEIPHLGLKFTGHADIHQALTGFFATMDYVLQHNAPAVIQIDGDRAQARSGIRECGKSAGKLEGFEYFGIYADALVRTGEGWKFERRVFEGIGTSLFGLVE